MQIYGFISNTNNEYDDGTRALRIAIVDIDVHHGNGTEEIVRNLRLAYIISHIFSSVVCKTLQHVLLWRAILYTNLRKEIVS